MQRKTKAWPGNGCLLDSINLFVWEYESIMGNMIYDELMKDGKRQVVI